MTAVLARDFGTATGWALRACGGPVEVVRHAGVDAAHAHGEFLAMLTAGCEHHHIPYSGVPVDPIKKHAPGKGNANKDDMIAAVRALGNAPGDDNEADALALLARAMTAVEGRE